jgi:uncharacterized damage-inducible protein DinB
MNQLKRQVAFDAWANAESLNAVMRAGGQAREERRIIAHIFGISELWACRVEEREALHGAWPTLSIDELESICATLADRWLAIVARVDADASIRYRSSRGWIETNSLGEIVQEVALHAAHHRGQIALLLRRQGHEPPASTDFIPALRTEIF